MFTYWTTGAPDTIGTAQSMFVGWRQALYCRYVFSRSPVCPLLLCVIPLHAGISVFLFWWGTFAFLLRLQETAWMDEQCLCHRVTSVPGTGYHLSSGTCGLTFVWHSIENTSPYFREHTVICTHTHFNTLLLNYFPGWYSSVDLRAGVPSYLCQMDSSFLSEPCLGLYDGLICSPGSHAC